METNRKLGGQEEDWLVDLIDLGKDLMILRNE